VNITHRPPADDAGTDVRRLLDAGYQVTFTTTPAGYEPGSYMASITNVFGSHWRGAGKTPAQALRSVWPLGYEPGQGGCGHCSAMGCTVRGCPVCAAYSPAVFGSCGVCGYTQGGAR
jgi:hypothetical protein